MTNRRILAESACFALAIVLAALRVAGMTLPAFQAVAHLFVGGLVGWGLRRPRDWVYVGLAGALTLVELGAFLSGVGRVTP